MSTGQLNVLLIRLVQFSEWASLIARLVKNLPAKQETPIRFLGWEDPMEKGTHSSILAWKESDTAE